MSIIISYVPQITRQETKSAILKLLFLIKTVKKNLFQLKKQEIAYPLEIDHTKYLNFSFKIMMKKSKNLARAP